MAGFVVSILFWADFWENSVKFTYVLLHDLRSNQGGVMLQNQMIVFLFIFKPQCLRMESNSQSSIPFKLSKSLLAIINIFIEFFCTWKSHSTFRRYFKLFWWFMNCFCNLSFIRYNVGVVIMRPFIAILMITRFGVLNNLHNCEYEIISVLTSFQTNSDNLWTIGTAYSRWKIPMYSW